MDHKEISPRPAGLGKGPMSLLSAMKDYFGMRPDQKSALDFGKEYKAIPMKDREEFKIMLEAEGYAITEPAPGVPAHA